ncbi:phage portal protein [Aerococcaceae bacterium WGS1372]
MAYIETFVSSNGEQKTLKLRFDRTSREVYRANDFATLEENGFEELIKFINHHREKQAPRIRELYDYAEGNNHTVLEGESRRLEQDATDTRAVHNFGKSVATFNSGYIAGNPIQINYINQKIHDGLQEIARANDFNELHRNLIWDLTICGRAYDITYRTEDDKTKVRRLDPMETFVIFDNTLSDHSLCGVRYYSTNPFGDASINVEIYTDHNIKTYEMKSNALHEIDSSDNLFGEVQITEYKRNLIGMGAYETELDLFDLYDAAQSDTANYMKDLSDAILFISGRMEFPEGMSELEKAEWLAGMKRARLILGQPEVDHERGISGTIDAKYLYKQYDVAGTEAYKDRIANDIHKFTNMPDLTDEKFGGNRSGESMKYKLFGLDQERMTTESLFRKGLTRRIELIVNIESLGSGWESFDPTQLTITFTPNKTLSELDVINTARNMFGMTSDLTVLEQLSKATGIDAEDELERIEFERGETPPLRREPLVSEVTDGEDDQSAETSDTA